MKNLDSEEYKMLKSRLRFVSPKEAFAKFLSKEFDFKTVMMVSVCDSYLEYKQTYEFFKNLDENIKRLEDLKRGLAPR